MNMVWPVTLGVGTIGTVHFSRTAVAQAVFNAYLRGTLPPVPLSFHHQHVEYTGPTRTWAATLRVERIT